MREKVSRRNTRNILRIVIHAGWTTLATATCQTALANCNAYSFSVSQPLVERFVMRPSRLLDEYREGGPGLTSLVSLIASSSRAAIPALITQARMASPQQRRAIAFGLANAAKLCAGSSPETAKLIETSVRKQTETSFQTDFQSGFVDVGPKTSTDIVTATRALRPNGDSGGNAFFGSTQPGSIQPLGPVGSVPQITRYDLPIR